MAQPVIIDTDIGADVDDTWALAMALRCPELDVRLVTVSTGDPRSRAGLVADLLAAAGRSDVPIGIGRASEGHLCNDALRRLHNPAALHRHPGGVHDGVEAMLATADSAPGPCTFLALGPLTTVAAALRARPRVADGARLVGMQGSYRDGFWMQPDPVADYNVAADVEAARQVFAAPWTCTLAPLDTCCSVKLSGQRYQDLHEVARDDRLIATVLEHQRAWFHQRGQAELFAWQSGALLDTVAVQLCYDESFLRIESVHLDVFDDGVMHRSLGGPALRLATAWRDQEAFLDHLVHRLSNPVAMAADAEVGR